MEPSVTDTYEDYLGQILLFLGFMIKNASVTFKTPVMPTQSRPAALDLFIKELSRATKDCEHEDHDAALVADNVRNSTPEELKPLPNSTFYTPTNVEAKCIVKALECVRQELVGPAENECNDPRGEIRAAVEYLDIKKLKNRAVNNLYGAVSFAPVDTMGHQATVGAGWVMRSIPHDTQALGESKAPETKSVI
ncbi:hypothetical protein INR49_031471 [Caranx melampygus]|nr:hypothetical protein INR49_031471 [Caranx melampygus]